MRKVYYFLLVVLLGCVSCEWQLKSFNDEDFKIVVERYDRVQSLYLTTGDFSALQQMNTVYPMQTRTLIEDVLRIGKVNDHEINRRFLLFYQDSTLQVLISEAEQQYANMEDINQDLTAAFGYLREVIPTLEVPEVYAQIGSLDQSIIVGNNSIGICLDKYLGGKHPIYQNPVYGYTPRQLQMMNRAYIVPDCVGFYLLSLYPMPLDRPLSQQERDIHVGKIQWTVNHAMGREVFHTTYTQLIDRYMKNNKNITIEQMLCNNNYDDFKTN
ncbi:MAG: gliding motility protein GldB [Prevotella sp.]|nr:gliding motility protein GldB [Prevotella sp.]